MYRHVLTSKHMRTDMYLPVSICRYVSSSMRTQVSTCIYRYMYAGIYLLIHVSGYVSTSTCMWVCIYQYVYMGMCLLLHVSGYVHVGMYWLGTSRCQLLYLRRSAKQTCGFGGCLDRWELSWLPCIGLCHGGGSNILSVSVLWWCRNVLFQYW